MAFKDWFVRRTPLQLALLRCAAEGTDLAGELRRLGPYAIQSAADAEAICEALAKETAKVSPTEGKSNLRDLLGLFQEVEGPDCPAFAVMAEKGTQLLVLIVDRALRKLAPGHQNNVLFALKVLAMYGTRIGAETVARAARTAFQPDDYLWSVILGAFTPQHPQREWLYQQLSNPLPTAFLAVSLLDSANAAHHDGATDPHPFDSAVGVQQIERWLTDKNEERFSYAVSAASALPFIDHSDRDRLLALALDHPSSDVQMEGAWAAAKLGRDAGVRWLSRTCLDYKLSARAKHYLEELGRADAIPADSNDPEFQAKAEFAQWLAHPHELGHPPDELEVVDHRELDWPPEGERKSLWLVKYRVKDETGLAEDDVDVGLVGSVTFCLFTYKLRERPPEDCYAIHCCWELSAKGLITEADVPETSREYDGLLKQYAQGDVTDARIFAVTELSPGFGYPQSLVGLARATRGGEPGWIVLDGQRSRWYAKAEMPADVWEKTVSMVHIGCTLLGFQDEPNRRAFLLPASPKRSPEQIVQAYERFLEQAGSNAIDSFSPLEKFFDDYVDALIELNRSADVAPLVERFRSHWDHNMGYGKLGTAAFKGGHDQLAESLILQLRHSCNDWCRCEQMNALAEIWCKQGRAEEGHSLLIDALQGLVEQSRSATGSDCALFEKWFQERRAAYLRLFPDRGIDELGRHGIPPATRTS